MTRFCVLLILLVPVIVHAQTVPACVNPEDLFLSTLGTIFPSTAFEELPNNGRIWSLLQDQEPSTVTEPLDTGGLQTGNLPLFGAFGASWTENQYLLNGFDLTDPYIPGQPLFDANLNTAEQIDFHTAAKSPAFTGSGVNVDVISPSPSSTFHGDVSLLFSHHALQSDDTDAQLRNVNFPGADRFQHLFDTGFEITGKIPQANWPVFVSYSGQQASKDVGGFPEPVKGSEYSVLAATTPLLNAQTRLDVIYAAQRLTDSNEGASVRVQPSATLDVNHQTHVLQAIWKHQGNREFIYEIGLGFLHANLNSAFQNQALETSTIDLPERNLSGSAPLATKDHRTRFEANGKVQKQNLLVGFHFELNTMKNNRDSAGGLRQILVNGEPSEIIRWNTPAVASSHTDDLAFFASDSWTATSHLWFPVGVRFETSSGQSEAGTTVRWTSFQPRAAAVFTASQNGPAIVASWSRYGHLMQGRYFDFGDPSALSGQVFQWNDLNHNQQVDAGETGQLLSRFGGAYSQIDADLKQPSTDELTIGIAQDFGKELRTGVRFFYRKDHNLVGLENTGVPFSDYFAVPVMDPGNDGIPGTSDDSIITLYDRNPAFLGKDFFLLTNPSDRDSNSKGFEIAISKSFGENWEAALYFTAMKSSGVTNPGNFVFQNDTGVIGNLGADPNTLILADSTTFFDRGYTAKLTACYHAPSHFRLGVVARYYDGLPFGRLLFVSGFNQGPFYVRVTPRDNFPEGFRTEFNATLDLRVTREFVLRKNRLELIFDVFNLLNMSNRTFENDLTGKQFRFPISVQAPRTAVVGFEWKF